MFQSRLNVLAHQGNDDENAEDAIDDAGNGSEKVNEKFESVGNSCGGELREKNGSADAQRHSDQQGYPCCDERSVNEGQGAEMFEDGVPDGGAEKIEAELVAGERGGVRHIAKERDREANARNEGYKGRHCRG